MAKRSHKSRQGRTHRNALTLEDLPRKRDLVVEGGMRTLGVYVREQGQTVQPTAILWVDAGVGTVLSTTLFNPQSSDDGGLAEAVALLEAGLTGAAGALPAAPGMMLPALAPGAGPARAGALGLPASIRVDDPALADALRTRFAPLHVPLELAEELPAFEQAFASLSEYIGADPDAPPPEPFAWDIDTATVAPLYKAAAAYARGEPWLYMPDHPPIAVALGERGPQEGVDTLYASILGAGEEVFGAAFYYSLDAYRRHAHRGEEGAGPDEGVEVSDAEVDEAIAMLRNMGAPVDAAPPAMLRDMVAGLIAESEAEPDEGEMLEAMEDTLVVFFDDDEEESDPTYLEWLDARGLGSSTRYGVPSFTRTIAHAEPRQPDAREVGALTLALESLTAFLARFKSALSSERLPAEGLHFTARVGSGAGRVNVDVAFPPPGYVWDEDEGWYVDEEDVDEL